VVGVRSLPYDKRQELYEDALRLRVERGWGCRRVSKALNLSIGTVSAWLYGGHAPLTRMNVIDKRPSPELSYVLGVIDGDGWFYKIKEKYLRYNIGLGATDKEFIDEFNRCLSIVLKRSISPIRVGQITKGGKKYYCVQMTSRDLYNFLNQDIEELGSYIEAFPTNYLRGLYDSDGDVGTNKHNKCVRLGSINRDKLQYARFLLSQLGIHSHINPEGKYYRLVIGRISDIKKFRRYIGFTIERKQKSLELIDHDKMVRWTDEETKLITENIDAPKAKLMELFPGRSWHSIREKRRRRKLSLCCR